MLAARDPLNKRALARLRGAVDQHNGGVGQDGDYCRGDAPLNYT